MRVLFIGGTGNISAACSRLCLERGMEVFHLNRGQRKMPIPGVQSLRADIGDRRQVEAALGDGGEARIGELLAEDAVARARNHGQHDRDAVLGSRRHDDLFGARAAR